VGCPSWAALHWQEVLTRCRKSQNRNGVKQKSLKQKEKEEKGHSLPRFIWIMVGGYVEILAVAVEQVEGDSTVMTDG